MLGLAAEQRLPAVLTNAVRYADRDGATTADVLDAARRLVALDARHIDRTNAEGYLKSGAEMAGLAGEIAGPDREAAYRLLTTTREVAERAMLDPHADLGLGSVHFPELEIVGASNDTGDTVLATPRRGRARPPRHGADLRGGTAAGRRARGHRQARVRQLLPHRRRRRRPDPRHGRAGRGPRVRRGQPGQLPARHLRGRPDGARPADGAVPLAAAAGAARHRRRRRVRPAHRGLRTHPRPVRRRAVRVRLDDGHLPGAARDPRRRRRARAAAGEIDTLAKAFPHIRARDAQAALRELPELRASNIGGAEQGRRGRRRAVDLLFTWSSGSTGCRGTSRCTRAGCCCPTRRCSTARRSRRASSASR